MAWIAKLLFFLFAPLFGTRSGRVEYKSEKPMKALNPIPLGQVQLIDHDHKPSGSRKVNIWKYGTIYAALGLTSERFAAWEDRYGMDSLGVGTDGSLLAPGFPVLSKVAWTYIDPVDLSDSETRNLIDECEKAMTSTEDESAREIFRQIRDLAMEAVQQMWTLRFGHP